MRNTEAALAWIVDILHRENIAFEIDGGLAAQLYGSKRALADIDINVPEKYFHKVVPHVKEFLTYGPGNFEDRHWKLLMMTLKYSGQTIDIGALETMRYYDSLTHNWENFPSDLSSIRIIEYMGMKLPVINEIKLLIYKQQLARGVDQKDVKAMENQLLDQ